MTADDGQFYDLPGVHERYSAHRNGAPHLDPNHVMEEPAVLSDLGDPAGLRVWDLGCGDGRFGRQLLDAGARSYQGVDASDRMIRAARANLSGTVGTVRRTRIEDLEPQSHAFDLVVARLSLHYVADLARVLDVVVSSLAVGGRFIATVVHPVITSHDNAPTGPRTSWTVDDYFTTGPRVRSWLGAEVTWHHRTVENYVHALTGAGLSFTALRECAPDPQRLSGHPDELARRTRVPLFLLLSARA